jgi:hypothetical protein
MADSNDDDQQKKKDARPNLVRLPIGVASPQGYPVGYGPATPPTVSSAAPSLEEQRKAFNENTRSRYANLGTLQDLDTLQKEVGNRLNELSGVETHPVTYLDVASAANRNAPNLADIRAQYASQANKDALQKLGGEVTVAHAQLATGQTGGYQTVTPVTAEPTSRPIEQTIAATQATAPPTSTVTVNPPSGPTIIQPTAAQTALSQEESRVRAGLINTISNTKGVSSLEAAQLGRLPTESLKSLTSTSSPPPTTARITGSPQFDARTLNQALYARQQRQDERRSELGYSYS